MLGKIVIVTLIVIVVLFLTWKLLVSSENYNEVKPVTILILNQYNYHYEIIESLFTLFLDKINCNNIKKVILLFNPNPSFESYITNKYSKSKYNLEIIKSIPTDIDNIDIKIYATIYPRDLPMIRHTGTKPRTFYISHRVDKELLKYDNVYYLTPLTPNLNNYFIPIKLPADFNNNYLPKIPIFCVQGNIDEKRRNYKSLIGIFEKLKYIPFKIKLLGKGKVPKYLDKYIDKIIFKPNLNFLDYHKEFSDIYVILALIDDTYTHEYYTKQLTSSVTYSISYNIPLLCSDKLRDIYKNELKRVISYHTQDELEEQFEKLLLDYVPKLK